MTWFPETAEGDTLLDRVTGLRPGYAAAMRAVDAAIWEQDVLDAAALELCRLRIAQLLDCRPALDERTPAALAAGIDEAAVAELSAWPSSELFDAHMRTCLGYAEQLLMDAQGVTDEQAAEVVAALGEGGFLVLTYACGFFETTQRARILLGEGR